jgi:CubicO group peptidase (beta-lactamase class C family)
MTRYYILLYLGILFSSSMLSAQNAALFRQAAEEALTAFDTPGFAVGIIKDGEIILSEGFGSRTMGKDEAVDGNTLFAIASNTKAFIATAIAKLDHEGKLDLDAPVRQYLPYFELYNPYVSAHTTVRDLLCHRVGLGTFSGDAIWYKSEKTAEEIIRQIRHLPAAYSWRGGYGYTNLMFITAGEVIRAVTGMSWDAYVHQHFLEPLGMERTQTSVLALTALDNIATPHITHRNNLAIPMAPWEASGAAGGIISSTSDMLAWLGAQLAEGKHGNTQVFPAAAQEECMRIHNALGKKLEFSGAGLGWFIQERAGHAIVTHGGGYDGMYSRVILVPELELGIVVLTNSMTGLSSALGGYIRDTYLGMETDAWLQTATEREQKSRLRWQEKLNAPRQARMTGTTPTLPATQLSGTYHDPLYGKITVEEDGQGQLILQFEKAPALGAQLWHWHYDTWQLLWQEPHAWFDQGTVQFILDNNREVTGLRFDVPNNDIFFEELEPVKIKK